MSEKLNAAVAAGGMAITAAVTWLTSSWSVSLRLVVIGIIAIVFIAQATVLFDRYGKKLTGIRRLAWAAGVVAFPALLALAGCSATLWLNTVRYSHGVCPESQGWHCVSAEAAIEPTVVSIGLSVQQSPGARAEWFPGYWSSTRTGSFSVEPSASDLRVRVEEFSSPTQFGVAYLVVGSIGPADLNVSLEPGTSMSLLTVDEVWTGQSQLALSGGGLWVVGVLWLFSWPRLKSLLQPPSKPAGFNTRAE